MSYIWVNMVYHSRNENTEMCEKLKELLCTVALGSNSSGNVQSEVSYKHTRCS
jgi:hypothetical protein